MNRIMKYHSPFTHAPSVLDRLPARSRNHVVRVLSLGALVGIGLAAAGCGSGPEGAAPKIGPKIGSASAALTAEQCAFFEVGGSVQICHHTGSAKKPYNIIRVSTAGCVSGHAKHVGDYVAFNDPTCSGGGCFPLGAPNDPAHPVPCCDGLDYDASGHCAVVDPTCQFTAGQIVGIAQAGGATVSTDVPADGSGGGCFYSTDPSNPYALLEVFNSSGTEVYAVTAGIPYYEVFFSLDATGSQTFLTDLSTSLAGYQNCASEVSAACLALGFPDQ